MASASALLQTRPETIQSLFEPAFQQLQEESAGNNSDELSEIRQAMEHALLVIERSAQTNDVLQEKEVNQIRDFLFSLLSRLVQMAEDSQLSETRQSFEYLYIPFSLWIAEHHGTLIELEPIVNAIASFANHQHQTDTLTKLTIAVGHILDALPPQIKEDVVDRSDPARPWRILNLNRGIIATRSHDPEIMQQAYSDLVKNIPDDARQFFNEAQKQMEIIDYPEHVKQIMQQYNDLWGDKNALH